MTRTVPDFSAGLVQLRASCGLGEDCRCALRIEATGDVDELVYLLEGAPFMLTFGLPLLDLADMMMGMLVVSNLNQTGLRELPPLEDADLLDDDRLLFGEELLDDDLLDGLIDDDVNAMLFGDVFFDAAPSSEQRANVMDDIIRQLAEPPFDLVPINNDGPERELYGSLPQALLPA